MRVDFHSHVLPMLDDGANSTEQSLEMLSLLKNDGVDIVVATPHFYIQDNTIEDFLKARADSFSLLSNAITQSGKEFPQIRLGAEVYFSPSLQDLDLSELCIENTDYLLLELPYRSFSTSLSNSFYDFVNYCEHNIILAHIERYFEFNSPENVEKILQNEVLAQFNCDSVLEFGVRRKFFKLLFSGEIHIMGSDAHDPHRRPPRFARAEKYLRSKFGHRETDRILKAAQLVLENANIGTIASLRHNNF